MVNGLPMASKRCKFSRAPVLTQALVIIYASCSQYRLASRLFFAKKLKSNFLGLKYLNQFPRLKTVTQIYIGRWVKHDISRAVQDKLEY